MNDERLARENELYADTGGISQRNRSEGFQAGFLDADTGEVYLSRDADGQPSPIHRIDGLPDHLAVMRSPSGRIVRVKNSIVSGFVRCGRFYTRAEAAAMVAEVARIAA